MNRFTRFFFTYIWVFRWCNPTTQIAPALSHKTTNESLDFLNDILDTEAESIVIYEKEDIAKFCDKMKKIFSSVPVKQTDEHRYESPFQKTLRRYCKTFHKSQTSYMIDDKFYVQFNFLDTDNIHNFDYRFVQLNYMHRNPDIGNFERVDIKNHATYLMLNYDFADPDIGNTLFDDKNVNLAFFKNAYIKGRHRRNAYSDWFTNSLKMQIMIVSNESKLKSVLIIGDRFTQSLYDAIREYKVSHDGVEGDSVIQNLLS